jgi:hypothetical protein
LALGEVERKGQLDADAATLARKGGYDQAYYQALLDVAKGAIDRSRSAAELVQKAAAAIGTLYVGILGVSFSVSNHHLPPRGLAPAVFLGIAIILSTAYVAYLTPPEEVSLQPLSTSPPERLQNRLDNFYAVIEATVARKTPWLRAAVVALGLGVVLLPAPFLSLAGADRVDPSAQTWPAAPVVASDRASLEAILYKAQVDEVAARRQQLVESTSDVVVWAVICLVGLAGVAVIALRKPRGESS